MFGSLGAEEEDPEDPFAEFHNSEAATVGGFSFEGDAKLVFGGSQRLCHCVALVVLRVSHHHVWRVPASYLGGKCHSSAGSSLGWVVTASAVGECSLSRADRAATGVWKGGWNGGDLPSRELARLSHGSPLAAPGFVWGLSSSLAFERLF